MRVRALFLASVAALLTCAAPASAATFTVTGTLDGAGSCTVDTCTTLRAAIVAANGNGAGSFDGIALPAGTYTLTSALPTVTNTIISGASAATTRIEAGGTFRTLSLASEAIVSLAQVTVANGTATSAGDPIGGNIRVGAGSTLVANQVRVTNGRAGRGGGIGISGGSVAISHSLIDNNQAVNVVGANLSGDGGGLMNDNGGGNGHQVQIVDSTIAFNKALSGAGIVIRGSGGNTTTLTRSTVGRNDGTSTAGGGIYLPDAQTFTAAGSIVSNNTGNIGQLAQVIAPSNCAGATAPASGGANVESLHDCNFTGAGDVRDTDPQLAAALADAGGETFTLPIPRTSPAVDRIPIGLASCGDANQVDQRGVARPLGAGCDAGAYEADVVPPGTTIDSAATNGMSATITFSSNEPGTLFECRLDSPAGTGTFAPCTSPVSFTSLAPGSYVFFLRATDPAGNTATISRAFTIAAPPPVPVVNKTVVITPVSGKVLVRLRGSKTFVPVDVTRGIPDGATVDTTKGRIRLTAIPKAGKPAESALFFDGMFQVRLGGGVTELRLNEELAKCPSGHAASAAAKKTPKTRKLWGDGSGSFRTRGQYSAATVRGTRWLVQDSCGKTLTRVSKGVVSVQDFVKHKKVLLRAPHSYTARRKH